jgi:hypothetical protein
MKKVVVCAQTNIWRHNGLVAQKDRQTPTKGIRQGVNGALFALIFRLKTFAPKNPIERI